MSASPPADGARGLDAEGATVVPTPADVVEGSARAADDEGEDAVDAGAASSPANVGDGAEAVAEDLAADEDAVASDAGSSRAGSAAPTSEKKAGKRKASEAEPAADGDDEPLTQAEISQRRINSEIDRALKAGKKRTKKRKGGDDDLDQLADEEVERLKQEMIAAADEDVDLKSRGMPATEKLKLLPTVVSTLQKTHLQQSILDNNLLEGVRRWLEPLRPDGSLPALNIQRQFFAILETMHIDEISLKMSGLGKVVLFYSMCNRVDPRIKRSAEKLIEVWSRPILKRSASYRTRTVEQAPDLPRKSKSRARNEAAEIAAQIDPNRRHVAVPKAVQTGYRYAPPSAAGASGQDETNQQRVLNHKRLNEFKGKLKAFKKM